MNQSSEDADQVISYLNHISQKYIDLKHELQQCKSRIRDLEENNQALKLELDTIKSSEYQPLVGTNKRKAPSFDQSHTSFYADQSVVAAGPNDTHNSFSHEDEFNVAIQDISSRTEDEDAEEEVISATPVAPTSAIKRERFKSTFKDQKTPAAKSLNQSTNSTPNHKVPLHETVIIKPEPKDTADILQSSPLRGIENDSNIRSNSHNRSAWISTKIRPVKQENRPIESSSSEEAVDVSMKLNESSKDYSRKSLSLSSRKNARLKQSVLDFSTGKVKRKLADNDLDETYCDDVSFPRNKSTRKSSENLFDFAPKNRPIKQEPPTQKRNSSELKHKTLMNGAQDYANSSSVFALPSQTDEIVMVDDSEPLFASQDMKMEPVEIDAEHHIRTEYKQKAAVRTIKEKAAQPGFMCPDCAPWFKYIGAGLSDREIQKRLDMCSRHRIDQNLPSTPEGFWVPYFEPTQEADKQETLVHYRHKSKKQLLDESSKY